MSNSFCRAITQILRVVTIAVLTLLLAISLLSTCTMSGDYFEHTYFLSKSPVPCILAGAILFFLLFLFRSRFKRLAHLLETDDKLYFRLRILLICLLFAFSAMWVLLNQTLLYGDEEIIQQTAEEINDGDFSSLEPDGYLQLHQHQMGFTIVMSLLQHILGRNNYVFFQLLEALIAVGCYLELAQIGKNMGMSRLGELATLLTGLLFFPLLLYATFIYGTLAALFFSLLSFDLCTRRDDFSVSHAILSTLAILAAIFLKQNSLIFYIALFIYSVFITIEKREARCLLFSVFLCVGLAVTLQLPQTILKRMSGMDEIHSGISPWSYVTMGMQDGDIGPGWFNGYNGYSYAVSGQDTERQKEMVLSDLLDRMAYFREQPSDALRFFLQKTASEWNNPTFQSFWLVQMRDSQIYRWFWIRYLSTPMMAFDLTPYLGVMAFIILLFALFSLFPKRTVSGSQLLLYLTFFGGFLFHCMWEAKGQYTLPYFTLLIPLAVVSFENIVSFPEHDDLEVLAAAQNRVAIIISLVIFILSIILILTSGALFGDNAAYAEYLEKANSIFFGT